MPSSLEPPLHDIQLQEAWLAGVQFEENGEFDTSLMEEGLSYTVESRSSAWLEPFVGGGLRITVEWQDKDAESCDGPFRLMVAVHGTFTVPEAILQEKGEQVERWLNFTGPFLLWPYARSYVSTITALSQFSPLTLFTLALPRPRALEEETAEHPATPGSSGSTLPPG